MDLEKLAQTCYFEDHLDKAIRNQFVFGIRNRVIQSRLLEVRNLTLDRQRVTDELHGSRSKNEVQHIEHRYKKMKKKKSFQLASQSSTSQHSSKFNGSKNNVSVVDVLITLRTSANTRRPFAISAKKGTLEKVCQSKAKETGTDEAHHLEEHCVVKNVFQMNAVRSHAGKFLLDVVINHRTLTFEVVTGSPVYLVNLRDKRLYFNDFKIIPTTLQLISYCGNYIGVLGKMMVNIVADGEELTLPLHVAESSRHPLLGCDWLLVLNVDFIRVFRPGTHSVSYCDGRDHYIASALNDLLKMFSHVFDKRVGKIKGIQASLTVRKDTKPMYVKARSVQFAVRGAVEKEIDQFVSDGIWEMVDHSEWATPVVPVKKTGGRIRLCGDYKITLNPFLQVDDHPFPTWKNFSQPLRGERPFQSWIYPRPICN
ncbi:uncharacterized protein LOC131428999 [Malaya genurostris]|uniref:uncharacterized protein LOC131428999 n=1 Tax=Malaya genurostris TaxID=325434 RepID=UPI0026F3F4A3|nr:uncharacterized protein LOC131428999 [Malaya genurostris]